MIIKSRFTVAIADNFELMRNALATTLNSWGYNVTILAENGNDLVEKIHRGQVPDICVVDINMPIMDGFQTTKLLKEKWPNIRIMIFSMNDDLRIQEKAIACGADAYLTKYTSIEKLKEVLEKLGT